MMLTSILLLLILLGLELWAWRLQREQRKHVRELEARIDHLELALRELASAQVDLHRRFLGATPAAAAPLPSTADAQRSAPAAPSAPSRAASSPAGAVAPERMADDSLPDDERYAQARRLAIAGASARTIASQCRLGEEEAELLLRLHGRSAAAVTREP